MKKVSKFPITWSLDLCTAFNFSGISLITYADVLCISIWLFRFGICFVQEVKLWKEFTYTQSLQPNKCMACAFYHLTIVN